MNKIRAGCPKSEHATLVVEDVEVSLRPGAGCGPHLHIHHQFIPKVVKKIKIKKNVHYAYRKNISNQKNRIKKNMQFFSNL